MSAMEKIPSPPTGQIVSQWSGIAKEQAVQRMFTAIAQSYDLNNSLLSFGLHHRWKRLAIKAIPPMETGHALDIGAGTADLAMLLHERMNNQGSVAAMDLNGAMLKEGLRKLTKLGLTPQISCFQGNAEQLTFQDNVFDAVTAGFCIRNVGDIPKVFCEIFRVLKPGGRFVCLEFSRPLSKGLRALYDWYSFHLLPWIGTKVAQDHTDVYRYLPASIRAFPDQQRLAELLSHAGFQHVQYRNLTGGIVAIHIAVK